MAMASYKFSKTAGASSASTQLPFDASLANTCECATLCQSVEHRSHCSALTGGDVSAGNHQRVMAAKKKMTQRGRKPGNLRPTSAPVGVPAEAHSDWAVGERPLQETLAAIPIRGPGLQFGTPVSGWQQQLMPVQPVPFWAFRRGARSTDMSLTDLQVSRRPRPPRSHRSERAAAARTAAPSGGPAHLARRGGQQRQGGRSPEPHRGDQALQGLRSSRRNRSQREWHYRPLSFASLRNGTPEFPEH